LKSKSKQLALRVSLIYCLVAGLWVLCSDWVLIFFVSNPVLLGKISMFKGLAFVLATTLLFYLALRNQLRRWEQESDARVLAEEKVRPLSQAVEQSPVSIIITDIAGNIEYVNRKFTEVTGYSFAEAVGQNPRILKSGELSAETYKKMWDTITGGGTWSGEFHNRKKNGELYWEWAVISPVLDAAGKPARFLAVKEDITRRKRVENSLRASEQKYRLLFENMLDGLAHCRMIFEQNEPQDFIYLGVNNSFEKLTGLKNVTGKRVTEAIPGIRKSNPELFEIYGRVALSGKAERFETCLGPLKLWLEVSVYSTEKECFVAIFQDITARKQAAEALRASEERFRLLTENASDIIAVLNGRGVLRFLSPSVERLLGYKPDEMTGQNAFEFIHPDDADRTAAALELTLSDPSKPVLAEFRFRHRNGFWHLLQTMGRSIPNQAADGFIVINARDITENRKLEEQLRQSQKMESFGQLAGGVAHDFNNILAVIQMQADLMKTDGALSPGQSDFARQIGAAAQRGASLTRQLLLFSRKQMMQTRDLELNESINEMTKMLRRTLGENIQLQFKFAMQPLFIHADPGMIDQVLVNLAVNSRDAMPGGGQLVIETSAVDFDELDGGPPPPARPGTFVCLSVGDNGCGIAPENLPRIFEPFFSTKDTGKGTGLGLATVFGIIQQHQGWINVYSEVGRGTTFRIYLPRLAKISGQKPAQPALTSMPGGHETILFAEDDAFLRDAVNKALSQLGYRVIEAVNGVEALEIWKQRRDEIDLTLTDLIMPGGMSGKDLGERLLKENPRLKVVYMSGYSPENAAKDFQLSGGASYLAKPFEMHQLAKIVRQMLDRKT
jgi:PAS domain S-box-containing protein